MKILCMFGHKWNGCKCSRCGETRDEGHVWEGNQCRICGKVRPAETAAPEKQSAPAKPAPTEKPAAPAQQTAPSDSSSQYLMKGWVFSCYDHDRVQAMSAFMNKAAYYSENNVIKMVRDWMKLPEDKVHLQYFAAPDWDAPNVTATETSFDCNIDSIYAKIMNYLISNEICTRAQAIGAIKQNMPYPKPGLLLVVFLVANDD